MDRIPPTELVPSYELYEVTQALEDIPPREEVVARASRGRKTALIWSGVVVAAALAFVGWLLVGPAIRF